MTGYFTTEELFEKNRELSLEFTKDFEIMENPLKIKNQTKSGNIETKENKIKEQKNEIVQKLGSTETKNTIEKTDNKNNIANSINEIIPQKNEKENLYKSVMPPPMARKAISTIDKKRGFGLERKGQEVTLKNIQRTKYSDYIINFQMLLYLINPQENIKETNPNFGSELEIFNENLEKYKRKLRIIKMEKEIEFLKKKNEAIKELNKDLEEAIKHKKENLEKVENQLKPNQVNYNNKLNQLKNNLNGRGQYQLIYDSFVYQKMAEVCFVFFNNKIQFLFPF